MKTIQTLLLAASCALALSTHTTAATKTWDGSSSGLWTAPANWFGNVAPANGDDLVFPVGPTRLLTTNSILSPASFTSITLSGNGYGLFGPFLSLSNDLACPTPGTTNSIGSALRLTGSLEITNAGRSRLVLDGNLSLNGRALRLTGSGSVEVNGAITNTGSILKQSSGELVLNGTNLTTAILTNRAGRVTVNGVLVNGAVEMEGGQLSGGGQLNFVNVRSGATVAPGTLSTPDVLTVNGDFDMDPGATLDVDLAGLNPGTGHDKLVVNSILRLDGATLQATISTPLSIGDAFTICEVTSGNQIFGAFAGLPEGATFTLGTNTLRITYRGGNGNDVVLTRVPTERFWTGLGANNNWSTPQNWAGNVAPAPGDRLIFPPTGAQRTNVNDFTVGTPFHSLSVTGSYRLTGAEIGLRAGLSAAVTNAPGTDILLRLTLLASQTFALSNTLSFGANLMGNIDLGSHVLTVDSSGPQAWHFFGVISGTGSVVKTGSQLINLSGANTYSGPTEARSSRLSLLGATLGSSASGTRITAGGNLLVNSVNPGSFEEPLVLGGELFLDRWPGTIAWNAPISIETNATVSFDLTTPAEFPFGFSGQGNLLLDAPSVVGFVVLNSASSLDGSLVAQGINLEVNGSIPAASLTLRRNPPRTTTLTGTGLVRALTAESGTIISPAGDAGGDGTISTLVVTQSLVMQGTSVFRVNLDGPNVSNYDQLDVLGTVNLGAGTAILDVQLGFPPPEGHVFVILDNDSTDAITGTFAGKPQGAIFTASGERLQISYTGGNGNDITLTVLPPPELTWTGAGVNDLWSTRGNWDLGRVPQDGDRLIFPRSADRKRNTNDLAGLDLHSLRFTNVGSGGNSWILNGNALSLGSGIQIHDSISVNTLPPVLCATPQTLVVDGYLDAGPLTLNADVTATGTNRCDVFHLSGSGRLLVNTPRSNVFGTNSNLGGLLLNGTEGIYAAFQTAGAGVFATNSTVIVGDSSAINLGLHHSELNLGAFGGDAIVTVQQSLTFSGASRLLYRNSFAGNPVVEAGGVQLGNATLVITNTILAFNDPVTIVRKLSPGPVSGTFNGLPEGGLVTDHFGTTFRVSYVGGDGNDVTLTAIPPVTGLTRVWTGLGATDLWSDPANWQENQPPVSGDSVEFPNAPRRINTNDLNTSNTFLGFFVNRLRFTSPVPLDRMLAPLGGSNFIFTPIRLLGGLDFQETGTLRFSQTNQFGQPIAAASQTFSVKEGGKVIMDSLSSFPGVVVTKDGPGELELVDEANHISTVALSHRAGLLRVSGVNGEIVQTGGVLELLISGDEVRLFGGDFQTSVPVNFSRTRIGHLDASEATNAVTIQPGRAGSVARLEVANGVVLNSNVTLRLDVAGAVNFPGVANGTNDFISLSNTNLGATNDFAINGARLELNFLPGFNPSPLEPVIITVSAHARTNLGTFAGLPHANLLTNDLGVFRISYRNYTLPSPFSLVDNSVHHDAIVLQRTIARPQMTAVINGPGAFKTVLALGTIGVFYVIEGSDDLVTWTGLSLEQANGQGVIAFTDPALLPFRFYRARIP